MSITTRYPVAGVYARKGEETCCQNGHLIATFTQDVMVGGIPKESDFTFAPGCNMAIVACPTCGGAMKEARVPYAIGPSPRESHYFRTPPAPRLDNRKVPEH